ncbi:MAG: di-trans,poly-cis-decaprenylcistransferase [Gammaproteobacteria bacterium]|nr:di-trans,poly-cis-decaprenylcistransferase [Gammaproteobacteria bacterium]
MIAELKKVLSASDCLPRHVAIIMDGNGRWAQRQGKMRVIGHKAGVDKVRDAVKFASELKIEALTLFAFSSENWQRPQAEVSLLMELFFTVLSREVKRLDRNNVKLQIIGDTSRFSQKLQDKIANAELRTANNTGLVLNIAANYGGRWDISQACRIVADKVKQGLLEPEQVTEELIGQHISMAHLPELDLLIRTGGDCRISNFLLWQCAYTELYFSECLWPDFGQEQFARALTEYVKTERRYGCTGEQILQTDNNN